MFVLGVLMKLLYTENSCLETSVVQEIIEEPENEFSKSFRISSPCDLLSFRMVVVQRF